VAGRACGPAREEPGMTTRRPVARVDGAVPPAPAPAPARDPTSRWEIGFCDALLAVALVVGGVLVVAGAPTPPVAPVLLLAVLVALSVNLGALFPSEFSATADVAILFAAVVGFAADAPLLGAFAVGLLMGPLDAVHWRQRLFYRMAYNSGAQALCILLAAVLYQAIAGSSRAVPVVLLSATAGALVWTLADTALVTLVLVRRGGTRTVAAARHVLVLDGLAVPLAVVGAVAGLLARDVGWWAAAALLAPMPFVPDLVLVRTRRWRPDRLARRLALPLLAAGLGGVGLLVGDTGAATLAVVAVGSVVAGADVVPRAVALVAPGVVAVVLAGAVVEGRAGIPGCVLALTGVVAAAAWCSGGSWRAIARAWAAGSSATVAGAVVVVWATGGHHSGSVVVLLGAALGALVFVAVDLALAPARVPDVARALWSLPAVLAVVADAVAWRAGGAVAGAGFLAAVGATVALAGLWAAPPWTSRALARARGVARGGRWALLACAGVAGALALAATLAGGPPVLASLTVSATSTAIALAAGILRQWHFARRRRGVDAVLVAGALVVVLGGVAPLAFAGSPWAVAAVVAVVAPLTAVAWPPASRADACGRGQRIPDSRSASA
jgi:hypothetical protein